MKKNKKENFTNPKVWPFLQIPLNIQKFSLTPFKLYFSLTFPLPLAFSVKSVQTAPHVPNNFRKDLKEITNRRGKVREIKFEGGK